MLFGIKTSWEPYDLDSVLILRFSDIICYKQRDKNSIQDNTDNQLETIDCERDK